MATYKPLQSILLTSTTASVTFSGIDQSYTDLIVVANFLGDAVDQNLGLRVGSTSVDTGSNYSSTGVYVGNANSALSWRQTGASFIPATYASGLEGRSLATIHLQNYANTTVNKSFMIRSGGPNQTYSASEITVGLWRNTSAISIIALHATASNNFYAGSTFDLYGVKAGAPQALGGDTVTTDGNYWYHTFRSTGAFIPQRPLTVDYLVVAGGGGGGNIAGGGGGAGGLRSTVTATGGGGSLESALSLSAQSYTIQVGAGGATAQYSPAISATNGTNSVFATITSVGGGYGGFDTEGAAGSNGAAGGSGGGGRGQGTATTGGNGTANQGFNGASQSIGGPNYPGAGGGGAGAAGSSPTSTTGGNGGAGVAVAISGSSVTYAGGGGGGIYYTNTAGTGGAGGGGNGGSNGSVGSNATANTGGGGGGGGSNGSNLPNGGTGGSGIVIVRYPV